MVQAAIDNVIRGPGRGDKTVILVAHRLSTVRKADSIAVIDQGQVCFVI
jgi:subfamily B ATP-binding cassette protein MsbA